MVRKASLDKFGWQDQNKTEAKSDDTTWRDKQKILAKERRVKRYRDRVKQYEQNSAFQNNERKFYQQVVGEKMRKKKKTNKKTITGCKGIKTILEYKIETEKKKKHNRNPDKRNKTRKKLKTPEESCEGCIHLELLRATLKKVTN